MVSVEEQRKPRRPVAAERRLQSVTQQGVY